MFPTKKSILRKLEFWMVRSYYALTQDTTVDEKKNIYNAAVFFYESLVEDYPKHQQTLTQAWENDYKPLFAERLKEVGVEVE